MRSSGPEKAALPSPGWWRSFGIWGLVGALAARIQTIMVKAEISIVV